MRLVVEREREIQAFRETKHFGAEVSFDQGSWRATWETAPILPPTRNTSLTKGWPQGRGVPSLPCPQLRDKDGPPGTTRALHHVHAVAGRERVTWLQARPYLSARAEAIRARRDHLPPHRRQNFSDESLSEIRAFAKRHDFPIPLRRGAGRPRTAPGAHKRFDPLPRDARRRKRCRQTRPPRPPSRCDCFAAGRCDVSVNTVKLESLDSDQRFLFRP